MSQSGPQVSMNVYDTRLSEIDRQNWSDISSDIISVNDYGPLSNLVGNYNARSAYLMLESFGFSIPTEATITGYEAIVRHRCPYGSGFQPKDEVVSLIKNGALIGSNQSTGTLVGTSFEYITYGSSSNLWGTSLTPGDVNSSTFGCAIAYSCLPPYKASSSVIVDYVSLNVYYTEDGGISNNNAAIAFFIQ